MNVTCPLNILTLLFTIRPIIRYVQVYSRHHCGIMPTRSGIINAINLVFLTSQISFSHSYQHIANHRMKQ